MQRIGTTDHQFKDGDLVTGELGTQVTAIWLNSLQEELSLTIEGLGGTVDGSASNMLLTRLQATFATILGTQKQTYTAFTSAGAAPAFTLTPTPAITALAANQRFRVLFHAAGTTGSNALSVSGMGAKSIMQYDSNGTLVPAVIPAGMISDVEYNGTYMILLDPIAPKMSVVGSVRNAKMSVTAASASATFTADEIIAETALGGVAYQIANYSKAINLATTGVGGMDTGVAPASGYVALYAIYNPTTATAALLAVNTTSSAAPNIYGGANLPAGYTASALVSVWPTNASGQFVVGYQADRSVWRSGVQVLVGGVATTYTSISLSTVVPKNATSVSGWMHNITNTAAGGPISLAADTSGSGIIELGGGGVAGSGFIGPFSGLPLITAQTIYYQTLNSSTSDVTISGYTF